MGPWWNRLCNPPLLVVFFHFEKNLGLQRDKKRLKILVIVEVQEVTAKSVRLDLVEKKTFNKEMKLLSTVLMRGNSLMFTNKNIEFTDDHDGNSDYNEISVIE